jgi:hypothetical protein
MAPPHGIGERALADIEFLLSECTRIHEQSRDMTLAEVIRQLPDSDLRGSLQLPDGRTIFCGVEALRRLRDLTTQALRQSDASGTVEPETVYRTFEPLMIQRFVVEQQAPDAEQLEGVLSAAIDEAKETRSNATHFVPCRLMYVKGPEAFAVGPVTFRSRESFHQYMEARFGVYVKSGNSPEQREYCSRLLDQARHYYDGFGWVGEVTILACDPKTSKRRAFLAITAALDILHLLFGAYHTERMVVGGPRLADDHRAHLYLNEDGYLDVSCSSSATSALGFKDGWDKFFERDDFAILLRAASKAIAPLVNPSIRQPLGVRFVDATSWFGDAAREQSYAAGVVKASNALEHLLATGERHGITKRLSERAAALCFDPERDENFAEVVEKFVKLYSLRSDLVHGSLSPFDPEVEQRCGLVLELAQRALCSALGFFESRGLLDRAVTNVELSVEFNCLVDLAKEQRLV